MGGRVGRFLAARPVLVVRVVLHVRGAQSLRLVDVRPLVELRQALPFGAEPLRDLRVVHLRVVEGDAAPLAARPHHERVHRALDARLGCRQRRRSRRRRRCGRRRRHTSRTDPGRLRSSGGH